MLNPQFILGLHHELVIDNFAGGGGASTGIERALGRPVDHAINHDRIALGMHRINHPQTVHHCEDVFMVDPATITEGRPVGFGWFSPDCRHFSKAKGGKPLDKRIRGLALVMLRWAKIAPPRVIMMENVEEIKTWGPLKWMKKKDKWGWYPDPRYVGRTWKAFLDCLGAGLKPGHPDTRFFLKVLGPSVTKADLQKGFGYHVETRELRGADYGAPTIRKRLFLIGRKDGRAIEWPAGSHADPKIYRAVAKNLQKVKASWRPIAECIDFTLPCPSIFLTTEEGKAANCRRPLAKQTLRRIAKGTDRYILKAAEPFIVSLTHQGSDVRVEAVSEPGKTTTGANRGEKGLVSPVLVQTGYGERTGQQPRCLSAGKPLGTIVGSGKHALGQATLAPFITEHSNASHQRNLPVNEPGRTQCGEVKGGHFAMVTGTVVHVAHGEADKTGKLRRGRGALPLTESTPTLTQSKDLAFAAVKLRGTNIGHPVTEPGHTASAGGTHHGAIAASLVRHFGKSIGQEVTKSGPTTVGGGGGKTGLLSAFIAQHNGGFNTQTGHDAREPLSTISQTGSQQQLLAASVAVYHGTEVDGHGCDEPGRTATTRARLGVQEALLAEVLTPEELAGARRVAAFLREYGVEFEGEFATVGGYVIVDLGMRMLTPRELFLAQGFPGDYVIDKAWLINPTTGELIEQKLTKTQQIRMCGNSVCPPVAEALVRANVPELCLGHPSLSKPRRKPALAA